MHSANLKGVIVPLLTPFDQDELIDFAVLEQQIEFLVAAGVDGMMVAGTTGEGVSLSLDERRQLAEHVIRTAARRVPVLIQAGTVTTRASIELAEHAAAQGADAVSILTPFFQKHSADTLIAHFTAVANAVGDTPVYLYNIPQNTGNAIDAAISAAVAAVCPNVVGEKDSSGSLSLLVDKLRVRDGGFDLLVGSDTLVLPALTLGVVGAVSGNANFVPELFVQLMSAWRAGDLAAAQAVQRQIHVVIQAVKGNIAMMKALLTTRGLAVGEMRAPYQRVSRAEVEEATAFLERHGIRLTRIGRRS